MHVTEKGDKKMKVLIIDGCELSRTVFEPLERTVAQDLTQKIAENLISRGHLVDVLRQGEHWARVKGLIQRIRVLDQYDLVIQGALLDTHENKVYIESRIYLKKVLRKMAEDFVSLDDTPLDQLVESAMKATLLPDVCRQKKDDPMFLWEPVISILQPNINIYTTLHKAFPHARIYGLDCETVEQLDPAIKSRVHAIHQNALDGWIMRKTSKDPSDPGKTLWIEDSGIATECVLANIIDKMEKG